MLQLLPLILNLIKAQILLLKPWRLIVILKCFLSELSVTFEVSDGAVAATFLVQLEFKCINLKLQLPNNIRILRNVVFYVQDVSLDICFDILCSVRVFECVVRVFVV